MILIVSTKKDLHTQAVIDALRRRRARATLLDLARFPRELQLTLSYHGKDRLFQLDGLANRPLRFDDVSTIWWRRPKPFRLHASTKEEAKQIFCYRECREAFEGLWRSVKVRWVDPPERVEAAEHKPWQLSLAQQVGLSLPRTCITSDPARARRFVDELAPNKVIYKALAAAKEDWHETRILQSKERKRLGKVRYAPLILQEYIEGVDIRATVVGKRLFAAEIDARATRYPVDFRIDFDRAPVKAIRLPNDVERALHRLVGMLGLSYSAIDLRRDAQGRYHFLESNPAGEWLFVEERTGQPIAEAMASLLTTGKA